jgi:protein tyrosine phosphatase
MGAEIGNKYAEKFSEETVTGILNNIISELHEEDNQNKKVAEKMFFIGQALNRYGVHKQRWSEWKNTKFKDVKKVSELIKHIESIFEERIFVGAATGGLNPTMAIMCLKNHYKWVDRHEMDHQSKGEKITPILGGLSVNNSNEKGGSPDEEG